MKKKLCSDCGGTGLTHTDDGNCPRCGGYGFVQPKRIPAVLSLKGDKELGRAVIEMAECWLKYKVPDPTSDEMHIQLLVAAITFLNCATVLAQESCNAVEPCDRDVVEDAMEEFLTKVAGIAGFNPGMN